MTTRLFTVRTTIARRRGTRIHVLRKRLVDDQAREWFATELAHPSGAWRIEFGVGKRDSVAATIESVDVFGVEVL